MRDLCYHEDGFNQNGHRPENYGVPLIQDKYQLGPRKTQWSILEFLYKVDPCKIESILECDSNWPTEDTYMSDYDIGTYSIGPFFNWLDFTNDGYTGINRNLAKIFPALDVLKDSNKSCPSWNGIHALHHDIESANTYRSKIYLLVPNDLYKKFEFHSDLTPIKMERTNLYGVHELVRWSEDEARKVLEKWTAEMTEQVLRNSTTDTNTGIYASLADNMKNLPLIETTRALATIGVGTVVYMICFSIITPSNVFKSATYAYFSITIFTAYLVPYISSMLTSLHKALEHKVMG